MIKIPSEIYLGKAKPSSGGGGAALPDQTGNAGKFLTTDGTNPNWADVLPAFPAPSKTVTAQDYTSAYDLSGKTVDYLQFNDTPENTFKNTVGKTVTFNCNGITVQMDYNYNTGANLYVTLYVGQDNFGSFYICQNGVFAAQDIDTWVNGTSFYWDAANKKFYADFTMTVASVTDMPDIFNDNVVSFGIVAAVNPLPAASAYSGKMAYVYETGTYSDIKNLIYSDGTAWQFLPGTLLMIPEERMNAVINQETATYCGIELNNGQLAVVGPNKQDTGTAYYNVGQVYEFQTDELSAISKWWVPLLFGQGSYQTQVHTLNKTSAYDPLDWDTFTQVWANSFSEQIFLQQTGSILQTVVFEIFGTTYLTDLVFKTDANSVKVILNNQGQGNIRVFYNGAEVSAADIAAGIMLKANSIICGKMYAASYNDLILELKDLPESNGTALVALSGSTATLAPNTDYTATVNGSADFTLPTPSDTGISNTITLLLNVTAASTIDWGVNANVAMTTFATGKYLIRLRYNNTTSNWIGEVLKGEDTVSPVKLLFHFDGNATDSSANPITLTANTSDTNFPVYFSGKFDNTQALRGYVNRYFTPSTNTKLNLGTGNFTISFWVKSDRIANNMQGDCVFYVDNYNKINPFKIHLFKSGAGSIWSMGIDPSAYTTPSDWHYITFTRSGNSFYYFIDGVFKASGTSSFPADFSSGRIAYLSSGTNEYTYIQDLLVKNTCDYSGAGKSIGDTVFNPPAAPYSISEQSLPDYHDDTKQDVLTSITGYDASKTQVLKNVQGVLTWVDEA